MLTPVPIATFPREALKGLCRSDICDRGNWVVRVRAWWPLPLQYGSFRSPLIPRMDKCLLKSLAP